MSENKIAVVILNWNGVKLLQQFLPSVVQFSEMATIQLFNKPVYTKCSKPDGSTSPGYIFNVTNNIDSISFNADEGQTDSDALSKCLQDNKSWWQTTLIGFLSSHALQHTQAFIVRYLGLGSVIVV
jgi:hypothetical protein